VFACARTAAMTLGLIMAIFASLIDGVQKIFLEVHTMVLHEDAETSNDAYNSYASKTSK
jgi:hypothetical protein